MPVFSEDETRYFKALDANNTYLQWQLERSSVRARGVAAEKCRILVRQATTLLGMLDSTPLPIPAGYFTEQTVEGNEPAPKLWMGSNEVVTAGGITGEWLIPPIQRIGSVVTVPGGPLPLPGYHRMRDVGHMIAVNLGVPVLLWDYHSMDGALAPGDVVQGCELARAKFGNRVVLVSHSFGGIPAAVAALGNAESVIPTALVAISSILSLDNVLPDPGNSYRAAGADPRAFRRKVPVALVYGSEDIAPCSPARQRDFAQAYANYGGISRLTNIAGGNHDTGLTDEAALEAVRWALG